MDGQCPKCGSSQIVNDECLKCGVIVSKVTTTSSLPSISYIAPAQSVPAPATQLERTYAGKKSDLSRTLVIIILLVLLAGAGYRIYQTLIESTAAYGGLYRNTNEGFGLRFPEKGWNHYYSRQLEAAHFKKARDAFYRGDDAEDPEVLLVVSREAIKKPVPERLDPDTAASLLTAIEDEVIQEMQQADLNCEITESRRFGLGENDGFLVYADLENERIQMKTMIFCGYSQYQAYTIQFLARDDRLLQYEDEILKMMKTFTFRMSII